ncbi:MAG: hypothetical protein NZ517_07610 [Candidatus Nitrosocaldus sp.]|nr:hypothetical protein [Candidatus Nitrosocaldus sp.]
MKLTDKTDKELLRMLAEEIEEARKIVEGLKKTTTMTTTNITMPTKTRTKKTKTKTN